MSEQVRKRKSSVLWNFFTEILEDPGMATCNTCLSTVSYRTSISNLKRHMEKKHPTVEFISYRRFDDSSGEQTLKRKKTSVLWNFFTEIEGEAGMTTCNLCYFKVSCRTSISNLKRHLEKKHPNVEFINHHEPNKIELMEDPEDPHGYLGRTPPESSTVTVITTPRPSTSRQNTVVVTSTNKSQIDSNLLELFYMDFQPLSIVQDKAFCRFVNSLNPSYELPSRSTISKNMIPSLYDECLNAVKLKLSEVQTCCLTTECWMTEFDAYMTTSIHFIDDNFELESLMLECSNIGVSHTAENIVGELDRITKEWEIENKVIFGVSDNGTNLKSVISPELKWEHFDCLVQTLHFIVSDALNMETILTLINKIKNIVSYFKRKPSSMEILQSCQTSLGKDPENLILDDPNRWNSMYAMISRFAELESVLQLSFSLISEEIPMLSSEEWDMCRQLCQVLKPFNNATSTISSEKYPSASLVIIIVNGLRKVCEKLLERDFVPSIKEMTRILRDALQAFLADAERCQTLGICTFLDPRFKMLAFENQQEAENTKKNIIMLIEENMNKMPPIIIEEAQIVEEEQTFDDELSLWNEFDESVKQTTLPGKSGSKALVEVERYLEEEFANRKENALDWWKKHEYNYPNLVQIVKERFCALASSIPCERVFTKTGAILNERRFKLSSNKLKMFLFLNANGHLIRNSQL